MAHHLLLADDSVTIQRVIKLTFADEDVEVVTVGDGNQAVAAIDNQPPDIVLADVAMPGRSGYEVAQHIRNSPRLAHIPVLLLTGAFEPVDEARATEVGCDGVLTKPFEPDVVVSRVKELLARPRPAAAVKPRTVATKGPFPAPVPPPATAAAVAPLVFPVTDPQRPADVDAYFERLDQAFATLALSPRTPAAGPVEAAEPAMPQTLVDAFTGLSTQNATAAPVAPSPAPVRSGAAAPVPPAPAAANVPTVIAPTEMSAAQVDQIVDRVIEKLDRPTWCESLGRRLDGCRARRPRRDRSDQEARVSVE